jgi:hypothetical protein
MQPLYTRTHSATYQTLQPLNGAADKKDALLNQNAHVAFLCTRILTNPLQWTRKMALGLLKHNAHSTYINIPLTEINSNFHFIKLPRTYKLRFAWLKYIHSAHFNTDICEAMMASKNNGPNLKKNSNFFTHQYWTWGRRRRVRGCGARPQWVLASWSASTASGWILPFCNHEREPTRTGDQ